ncbi:MAG: hypothetical protein GXO93_01105 [FCB group bacterium]|nr:hypothetical protein [FCB group bacterium]
MKKVFLLSLISIILIISNSFAASSQGTPFGSFSTARTLGMGQGTFGLGLGLADNTSFIASFTYGLSANTDGRLKIALVDNDIINTQLGVGADFKYQLISVKGVNNGPFDMALGAFSEYYNMDYYTVFLLGGQLIGSYPLQLSNHQRITPYGRFNARLEYLSFDDPMLDSQSNLEVGLNAGVKWNVSEVLNFYGEFQIDGNDGVFFGLDMNVL